MVGNIAYIIVNVFLFVTKATQLCVHGGLQTREAMPIPYRRINVTTSYENEASLHYLQWLLLCPFHDPERTEPTVRLTTQQVLLAMKVLESTSGIPLCHRSDWVGHATK